MIKVIRRISAALSAVMMLSSCLGPDENIKKAQEDDDIPVLTWLVGGYEQKDIQSVLDEVNKITVEKIGAKVDIQFIEEKVYSNRMSMNIANGNDFDLCFTGYINPYLEAVDSNGFLDITDWVENSEKLKSVIPEYAIEKTRIGGKIYAIPNMQILAACTGLFVKKDLADEYGLKREDIHSLNDIEPFLQWVKENKPDIYPFRTGRYGGGYEGENQNKRTFIMDPFKVEWNENGDVSFIKGYEEDDYFIESEILSGWYEKGYIRHDVAYTDDDMEKETLEGKYAVWRGTYKPGVEGEFKMQNGFECIAIQIGNAYISGGTAPAACTAIGSNSKYPELAFKLLEEVNTNKELFNLIAYGIEGRHYKRNDNGKIEIIRDNGYVSGGSWKFGNAFNSYILEGQDYDIWEKTKEFNDNALWTPVSGFVFDMRNVRNEINKVKSLNAKYSMRATGVQPVESYREECIKDYEAISDDIDRIIDEMNRQYEEWKAQKASVD